MIPPSLSTYTTCWDFSYCLDLQINLGRRGILNISNPPICKHNYSSFISIFFSCFSNVFYIIIFVKLIPKLCVCVGTHVYFGTILCPFDVSSVLYLFPSVFFEHLLSCTKSCFKITQYFPVPRFGISYFPRNLRSCWWKMVFRDQKQGAQCAYYCLDVITFSFFQQKSLIHTDSSINSDLVIQCYKLCLPLLHICIFCLPIM